MLIFDPHFPWYKVIMDAAVFSNLGMIGIGVIIRDHEGSVVAAMSKRLPLPLRPLEAEAKAIDEATLFAWEVGIRDIILEIDLSTAWHALQDLTAPSFFRQRLLYSSNPKIDEFFVEVHHGGKFLSNPIRYEGVAINYFDGNERDYWSAQELRNMVEKLGYMSYGKLWYRMPMVSLEDGGLRPVTIDNDDLAMSMADAVQGHKVIELYVEHCVTMPNIIDDVGDDINYFDNSKDSSGSDDAFDKMVMGPIDLGQASKEQDSNMAMGSNAKIVTGLSDNDQPYESEELLSTDDDDDNNAIPPYLVFIPPTNPKLTNFVKGMLFISLEQFKNAVTDYAVHRGWGIRLKKK
ncbi:hypothetical protein SO802_011813 [Lithocarpus litseifolius]|uniref:PB1-like domain-containing protein n=1 Tax=Lithocarpus litseifolius TaxID=425828 RepID=A0AAW2D118_9ROSI